MYRVYRSLFMKWNPERSSSNKAEEQTKLPEISEPHKAINENKIKENSKSCVVEPIVSSPGSSTHCKSTDEYGFFSRPSVLLKSLSRKSHSTSPTVLSKRVSRKGTSPKNETYDRVVSYTERERERDREMRSLNRIMSRQLSISPSLSKSPSQKCTSFMNESTCRGTPNASPNSSLKGSFLNNLQTHRGTSDTEMPFLQVSMSPSPTFQSKSASRSGISPKNESHRGAPDTDRPLMQRSMSRLSPTSHNIIFSQSTTLLRKPPPVEKKLECTLEELCNGCVKQIMISRDVIINGIIEQQGEMVNIIVKPGWKKGTKITFEGKGDERPGYQPADLIFLIDEKSHLLFKRVDDDLVYEVEIPLVQALTGCTISVPLLGGKKMSLSFDMIYPGYVKIIRGQGMPNGKEGKRGDLRIKFLINFPLILSAEQHYNASSILHGCCYDQ